MLTKESTKVEKLIGWLVVEEVNTHDLNSHDSEMLTGSAASVTQIRSAFHGYTFFYGITRVQGL